MVPKGPHHDMCRGELLNITRWHQRKHMDSCALGVGGALDCCASIFFNVCKTIQDAVFDNESFYFKDTAQ